jgi:SMI1-KNR4 cell-wall
MVVYGDFDATGLWADTEYARENYVGEPLTDDLVESIEAQLRFKLPQSYIELMRVQNGGLLAKTSFLAKLQRIGVEGIYGINRSKRASLGGIMEHRKAFAGRNPKTGAPIHVEGKSYRTGSQFWIEEWEYPPIGVYFAECPSGGHDMICMDYRDCGPQGEPQIVHVDQESGYSITFLADNFGMFVRGLRFPSPMGTGAA